MFRTFCSSLRTRFGHQSLLYTQNRVSSHNLKNGPILPSVNFSSLNIIKWNSTPYNLSQNGFLQPKLLTSELRRSVVRYSWRKGTRKTVRVVLTRFYRLNCGNWIRTIAGRANSQWRKDARKKNRHLQHVFCNATQCRLLDTMVSKYWRKPKYFIQSPYEPYEWREDFPITRRKPWRPEGCDYE